MRGVPLKRLAQVRVSNVDKKTVDGDAAVRLCNYTDVYYRAEITPDQDFMRATASLDQVRAFGLRTGDVIITKDSETPEDIGVATYVRKSAADLVCGYHLAVLRPDPRKLDARFLYWFMSSSPARDQMAVAATGVTRFGLRTDGIGGVRLPHRPLPEQRRVAHHLDKETARIDALIASKVRTADLLLQRETALCSDRVESLSEKYGLVPLRRLITRVEQGSSPVCDSQQAEGDEWGVLKTSAVSSGDFRAFENKRLPDPKAADLRWQIGDGDLLMTRGSGSMKSVGQAAVARPDGHQLLLSDLLYRVRLRDGDPDFIALVLRSPQLRQQIQASIRSDAGQTLKLRADDIRDLLVPAVPSEHQSAQLRACEREVQPLRMARARLLQQLDLLREHRQALVTAAVTGELDITGVA